MSEFGKILKNYLEHNMGYFKDGYRFEVKMIVIDDMGERVVDKTLLGSTISNAIQRYEEVNQRCCVLSAKYLKFHEGERERLLKSGFYRRRH